MRVLAWLALATAVARAAALGADPPSAEASAVVDASGALHVVPGVAPDAAAVGSFADMVAETGWALLTVHTDTTLPALQQHRAAGLVEGFLTAQHIDYYGVNQFNEWGFTPNNWPANVTAYFSANLEFMRSVAAPCDGQTRAHYNAGAFATAGASRYELEGRGSDAEAEVRRRWATPIACELGNLLAQLEGLSEGYAAAVAAANVSRCMVGCNGPHPLPPVGGWSLMDLALLNAAGDMETLLDLLRPSARPFSLRRQLLQEERDPTMADCSAVVRPDGQVAHATWRSFMLMNRVYKVVDVAGVQTAFTSSPSFLSSKDDFYVTSRGLAVMETTNDVFNLSLYQYVSPQSLLAWVRNVVANRLATDGRSWTQIFAQYNSGTYNNQYMIVDYSKLGSKSDMLWIIEQIPGFTESGDVTQVLLQQGYWASYNVPYFPFIYNISGYPAMARNNSEFDYHQCTRARMFAAMAPSTEIHSLIRYNQFRTDPLSKGDPARAIASRYDLRATNPKAFGAVDAKVVAPDSSGGLSIDVVAGPTTFDPSQTPPFSWRDPRWSAISHVGQPDTFNFDWVSFS